MISYRSLFPAVVSAFLMISPVGLHSQTPHPEPVGLRPDAPTYAKHGPYWVGAREFVIKEAPGGRTLPATLWYPALNPRGAKEANTVTYSGILSDGDVMTIGGRGLVDVPPDPATGPYPLVVYSHGQRGSRLLYSHHLAHLASHGFVVLGIDHGKNIQRYRPLDVVKAIDFAGAMNEADATFRGLIDTTQTAVEGHSYGGQTALELGSARVPGNPNYIQDPRVKAIISWAAWIYPSGWDFSEVHAPTLLMKGSNDRDGNKPEPSDLVFQALPATQKAIAILLGGTHYIFFNQDLPWADAGTLDKNRATDLINHFTTAFLLDVLKGDKEAHKALLPEAVKFEEVQYTTTWH